MVLYDSLSFAGNLAALLAVMADLRENEGRGTIRVRYKKVEGKARNRLCFLLCGFAAEIAPIEKNPAGTSRAGYKATSVSGSVLPSSRR